MAWFVLGALLLLVAACGGRDKAGGRLDSIGLAAIAVLAAAAWRALSVYSPGKVLPLAFAWAMILGVSLFTLRRGAPQWPRAALLAVGGAALLFALLGPAEGLFP